MKFTMIRNKEGKKLSQVATQTLAIQLVELMRRHGFITDWMPLNMTSFKLGLNSASFRVDTDMLGYNGKRDTYKHTIKGYKRTDIPTWRQREEYNHLINHFLDELELSANVYNGFYVIRRGTYAHTQWNARDNSFDIENAADLHEELESDKRIKEHRRKKYLERKARKIARRPAKLREDIREVLANAV